MFDVNTVIMFFTASVLLALAPGPDNLYVMAQSMLKGKSAGLLITLGLCTGLIGHTTAVAFGVAVLFQTSVCGIYGPQVCRCRLFIVSRVEVV